MSQFNDVKAIRISLASPEQIRSWSHGEVTKAETINYRTLKPERDGLFCERIFGPVKDYECHCGKYKKIRYKGVVCDKCGVEVAHSSVRRERMGHIELAAPVAHIWFVKLVPSRLGLLLDLSPRNLESVVYFARYIVTSVDEEAKQRKVQEIEQAGINKISEMEEEFEKLEEGLSPDKEGSISEINRLRARLIEKRQGVEEEIRAKKGELDRIRKLKLFTEEEYRKTNELYEGIFEAGMGAEAILEILKEVDVDALHQELREQVHNASGQMHKKASKRLQLVEALKLSGNRPEWMVLTVLPVLPPSLRPVVQLDGGRFVISDLNDLYRRVINRNNRLRRLVRLGAPQIIVRNEKRMLQEAVDSLIDNGRRGRVVTTGNNHELKSLAAMLSGKRGRFRQNLLGKRVDYSGRSVITVGPTLKLHQCGLPRHVALELFKPFVIHKLIMKGYATNLKIAKRQIEKDRPEVWDALDEAIKERPVLFNRAPTLHRLSIQAFEPVLIDGDAFQLHPLVCTGFNADFDGDQMAVHVPLSRAAVEEARKYMLSIYNVLLPSNGEPVMAPTLDMVLGCYYLTSIRKGAKGEGKKFANFEEAKLAYDLGAIDFCAEVMVRDERGERINTSVGRILFNEALPPQLRFCNEAVSKFTLRALVSESTRLLGNETTAAVLDSLKQLGFSFATKSGVSMAMNDLEEPASKREIITEAERRVDVIRDDFERGLITEDERYEGTVQAWMETTDKITEAVEQSLDTYGGIYMMVTSGAKGNISQISQMVGMRGLMTDPMGKIIDFPIKSSFREGLDPIEYFISTHGARKGLADTALRTSDSGYLTRRLIDVAQDVIVSEQDCGTSEGVWMYREQRDKTLPPFSERILGYMAASRIVNPATGEVIAERNEEIDEERVKQIVEAGVERVYLRSPLTCRSRRGVCQYCYGRDLGKRKLVEMRTAVGIVAAQSIGEPGTQLTLRTFHTGGVVGLDITTGLPRVGELFEARTPKGNAIISEIGGTVEVIQNGKTTVRVSNKESYVEEYTIPAGANLLVGDGQWVNAGVPLYSMEDEGLLPSAVSRISGQVDILPVEREDGGEFGIKKICIQHDESENREYVVPAGVYLTVKTGSEVKAGQKITEGVVNPQDILHIMGKEEVQRYLIDEVQKVYRSQGVNIHDKHIAVICRQMLAYVRITSPGDTELLPGEMVDRFVYADVNAKILAEGGEPATAQAVLLGVTRASLSKDSWLAAASFQETGRVLVDAALKGKTDRLVGLKENVILGKIVPAHAMEEEEHRVTEQVPSL
jgi:DNA-directed RNA polymerase subunit beta'